MIGYLCGGKISVKKIPRADEFLMTSDEASEESEFLSALNASSSEFCSQNSQRRTNRMHLWNHMPWERCFGGATDGIRQEPMYVLSPFSLIRDFRKQNIRRNVSKISVNHTCYRQIGSKSTNHSPLA